MTGKAERIKSKWQNCKVYDKECQTLVRLIIDKCY